MRWNHTNDEIQKFNDKNYLYNEYVIKCLTIKQIAKNINFSQDVVSKQLKKFGIQFRSHSENLSRVNKILTKEYFQHYYVDLNLSFLEISKISGISASCVGDYAKRYGFVVKKSAKRREEKIDSVLTKQFLEYHYLDCLETIEHIAKITNCGTETIKKWLHKHNIQVRTKSEVDSNRQYVDKNGKLHSVLELRDILSYDNIKKLYIDNNLSIKEIVEKTGMSDFLLYKKIKQYNLIKDTKHQHYVYLSDGSRMLSADIAKILNKEYLYDNYVLKNKSAIDIKNETGFGTSTVYRYLDLYGIERHTREQITDIWRKHVIQTNNEKYGKDYVTYNGTDVRKKINNNLIQKIKNRSVVNNNGVFYSNMSVKLFDFILKGISEQYSHLFYYSTHPYEYYIEDNNGILTYLDFSIQLDNIKLCIEFNGDYWHGNPQIYTGEQFFKDRGKVYYYKDIWQRDKQKLEYLNSIGYKTLVVWEKDFVENEEKVVQNCLKFINDNIDFNELGNKLQIDKDLYNELEVLTV